MRTVLQGDSVTSECDNCVTMMSVAIGSRDCVTSDCETCDSYWMTDAVVVCDRVTQSVVG